jgi:ubiquinone/menaquinone biosynthesis C-methylase UbiE
MLATSRKRCAGQPWVELRTADARKLPYPDASFDAAVSTQVYEYVAHILAALAELHRVLRAGGRAVILDSDYGSLLGIMVSFAVGRRGVTKEEADAWLAEFSELEEQRSSSSV